jgi:L-alanine-DL-glutamate epimerase-like enolase superfamily enzyme
VRGVEPKVDLIMDEATDFVRAEPDYDGGITGVMKIAHAAEGCGLDVEIHAPGPPLRRCMAAIRPTNYYELGLVHPKLRSERNPVYAGDYADTLDAIDTRGQVPVPQGPGLGVGIDWDYVHRWQMPVERYRLRR